jgi:hypothetical protein
MEENLFVSFLNIEPLSYNTISVAQIACLHIAHAGNFGIGQVASLGISWVNGC